MGNYLNSSHDYKTVLKARWGFERLSLGFKRHIKEDNDPIPPLEEDKLVHHDVICNDSTLVIAKTDEEIAAEERQRAIDACKYLCDEDGFAVIELVW